MILSLSVSKEQKRALLRRYTSIKIFLERAISNKANEITAGDDLEKELKEYHDRRVLNGYNIRKRKMTQATKDKISKSLKDKYRGTEHHLFEETKRLISIGNKGKIISQETRDKVSKANTGKKRTEEQRKRISEGHKGLHHNRKKV